MFWSLDCEYIVRLSKLANLVMIALHLSILWMFIKKNKT